MNRWAVLFLMIGLSVYGQAPNVLAIDSNGTVYTAGRGRAFIARSDGGSEVWQTHLGSRDSDQVMTVALGLDGNIWAAGKADRKGFVAELGPDGSVFEQIRVATPARPLSLDSSGSLYLERGGFIEEFSVRFLKEIKMKTKLMLIALLAPMLGTAGLIVTFDLPDQTGNQSSSLVFTGTVENTGPDDIYINSLGVSLTGPGMSSDTTPFLFQLYPYPLVAGQVFGTSSLFTVTIDPLASVPATYLGTLNFLGGTSSDADPFSATGILASGKFSVTVAAPEPSSMALFLLAAVPVTIGRRLRKRRNT